MTGLDLEAFLRLLRADLGAWASLGAIVLVLALMTWTSWGSKRALRKCLVISVLVHVGLVFFGGRIPSALVSPRSRGNVTDGNERIRQVRVTPLAGTDEAEGPPASSDGRPRRRLADWDRPDPSQTLALADPSWRPDRREPPRAEPPRRADAAAIALPESTAPQAQPPEAPGPESRPVAVADQPTDVTPPPIAPPDAEAVATAVPPREDEGPANGASSGPTTTPAPALAMPEIAGRRRAASSRAATGPVAITPPRRPATTAGPLPIERATPAGAPRLPEVPGTGGGRPLPDVPEVYRSRLDPNRSARAQRSGASGASEQAVERALDWLARHQDADGRWNGGNRKYDDGTLARGESDFTAHCPPGEVCSGPCFYWEADTAMTGLALLAYLGAGYTHADGKHAPTVEKGLQFLLLTQKPDGDLRGPSENVGMYCHAMASLALCEAYALTGDSRLREPVERAVAWIARSRAADGHGWRYRPGDRSGGDTSVLGWVVLVLKSAKVVGIAVPGESRAGAIAWLEKVAEGPDGGLAKYRPGEPISPTMTAEAWVCRQFLGTGGPGASSTEAANFLLRNAPARSPLNLYYWYYGTLAMYQHGGDAWTRWNAQVRDQLVRHQRVSGHQAGSWGPEDSKNQYDLHGGRIYCTALATLTLEVYYRYLRLYDEPGAVSILAPERSDDPSLRRAGPRPGPSQPAPRAKPSSR